MKKSKKETIDDILKGCRILTDRTTENTLEIIKLRKQIQEINYKMKRDQI